MEIFAEISQFVIAMLSIINPIGAIPVFLSLTRSNSDADLTRIARSCAIAIFVTLTISLFVGKNVLDLFGISIASFKVGGGILIGTMALNMLRARQSDEKLSQKEIIRSQEEIEEMGIVPLAIPLLAGPGAISSSIIYSQRFTSVYSYIGAVVGLFLISILVLFVLSQGRRISDRMGRIGVNVMTRIMGLILMATSVEFVTRGLKIIFNLN